VALNVYSVIYHFSNNNSTEGVEFAKIVEEMQGSKTAEQIHQDLEELMGNGHVFTANERYFVTKSS